MFDVQGPEAARVAEWSWLLFGVAGLVFVVVLALIGFALLRRRRGGALHDQLPQAQERKWFTFVLIAGGIVPAVVLSTVMGVNVYSERTVAAEAERPAVTVEVIGHQWWWEMFYPGAGFTTANEIHVPVGQRVELKLTSADVIHSFWVPQLSPKYDLIPGQTNTLTFTADHVGIYRGQCAELCGTQHAHMAFLVVVDSAQDYAAWTARQRQPAPNPTANTAAFEGQQLFQGSACVYCHAVRGTTASSRLGPDLTHIASRMALGAGTLVNNRGNLSGWIVNAQAVKPGNKMPPMYLSSGELESLVAYLETLR
ncbi:cytochrome c oxidase subunit II [Deinococcus humi]|uniref:cytochrome-c oxidase n=1 Tax=Deinococcus humi TaxID=662880 RepID=A0A7W8JUD7_9DEIO|nr:cytochrome c oxidase subunit II [Deinococcus humi]MBB5363442.1 cytochrome c oxidase subunit 2 [Deinococcus humi]GGO26492.1 cytochrome c oxidase subunit II [Deinococcus humi]